MLKSSSKEIFFIKISKALRGFYIASSEVLQNNFHCNEFMCDHNKERKSYTIRGYVPRNLAMFHKFAQKKVGQELI